MIPHLHGVSKCYSFHISRRPGPRLHCIMKRRDARFLGMNFNVNSNQWFFSSFQEQGGTPDALYNLSSMFPLSMGSGTFSKHWKEIHDTVKFFFFQKFCFFFFFLLAFYHKIHLSMEIVVSHWGVYLPKFYCYRKCMSHWIIIWRC